MVIQFVKFNTDMTLEEIESVAQDRAAQFREVPGLIQKYYARTGQPGQFAGVYLWETPESMQSYRDSDLAAGIPAAYRVNAPPEIEILDVAFTLRD